MIETGTEIGIEKEKEIETETEIETEIDVEIEIDIEIDQIKNLAAIGKKKTGRPVLHPLNLGTNSTARPKHLSNTIRRSGRSTNPQRILKSLSTKYNKLLQPFLRHKRIK